MRVATSSQTKKAVIWPCPYGTTAIQPVAAGVYSLNQCRYTLRTSETLPGAWALPMGAATCRAQGQQRACLVLFEACFRSWLVSWSWLSRALVSMMPAVAGHQNRMAVGVDQRVLGWLDVRSGSVSTSGACVRVSGMPRTHKQRTSHAFTSCSRWCSPSPTNTGERTVAEAMVSGMGMRWLSCGFLWLFVALDGAYVYVEQLLNIIVWVSNHEIGVKTC